MLSLSNEVDFANFTFTLSSPEDDCAGLKRNTVSLKKGAFKESREYGVEDQKSRGFYLHKSHMADAKRLARLLIAACLAYIWIIYLGALCMQEGNVELIHRRHRCDLSLFQLGLRFLEHILNEDLTIPVAFHIVI